MRRHRCLTREADAGRSFIASDLLFFLFSVLHVVSVLPAQIQLRLLQCLAGSLLLTSLRNDY